MGKIRVLVTGTSGYIGGELETMLRKWPDRYEVERISVRGEEWEKKDFSKFDSVIHLAAIVHKKETEENRNDYFEINRDLSVKLAKKAKLGGVGQFIFMSTMAVYGEKGTVEKECIISSQTSTNPTTYYAISKLEAENEINKLRDGSFKTVIVRPPMIYGPSCPGNYEKLRKLAKITPVFPLIENKRSVIHIEKLCELIKEYIDCKTEGLYCPQDDNYMNTSIQIKEIGEYYGRNIHLSKSLGFFFLKFGNRYKLLEKIFGNLVYEKKHKFK